MGNCCQKRSGLLGHPPPPGRASEPGPLQPCQAGRAAGDTSPAALGMLSPPKVLWRAHSKPCQMQGGWPNNGMGQRKQRCYQNVAVVTRTCHPAPVPQRAYSKESTWRGQTGWLRDKHKQRALPETGSEKSKCWKATPHPPPQRPAWPVQVPPCRRQARWGQPHLPAGSWGALHAPLPSALQPNAVQVSPILQDGLGQMNRHSPSLTVPINLHETCQEYSLDPGWKPGTN